MKIRPIYLVVGILLATTAVACSEVGQTIGNLTSTREAKATEAVQAQQTEQAEQKALLERIAPPGTNIEEGHGNADHDSSFVYSFDPLPPMSGTHNPIWQRCQVYDGPIMPQHAIHSMEHGAVWIAYQPDLDTDTVDKIEKLAAGEPFALVSAQPNLQSAVVLTAWGIQLEVDTPDDPRVEQFLASYLNGPQTPEPGATCTTGTTDMASLES